MVPDGPLMAKIVYLGLFSTVAWSHRRVLTFGAKLKGHALRVTSAYVC